MLDLGSPTLVRSVCRPISLPHNGSLFLTADPTTAISPVSFYGSFALIGNPYSLGPFYVQRCGSRKQLKITASYNGNSKIIIFSQSRGLELADGRTITFRLPTHLPQADRPFAPIVVGTHMFLAGLGDVWEAALPPTLRGL
jgi:hypothetical protein